MKLPSTNSNRANQLRQELKVLTRRFREPREEEKGPLSELQNILRKKLMTLRRAHMHSRRKERARKSTAFPFGFTKQLLGQKRSGQLACCKAEIDRHLEMLPGSNSNFLIDPPAGGTNHLGLHDLHTSKIQILCAEKKRKVTNKFHLTLGSTQIPSITNRPVKSLGKVFDCILKDKAVIQSTNQEG